MDVGLLKVGANVDIQRTDGRIHSAVVSGIDLDNKSLTVEWYERGETKGKELELETIFQLNPELRPAQREDDQYQDENEEAMSVDSEEEEPGYDAPPPQKFSGYSNQSKKQPPPRTKSNSLIESRLPQQPKETSRKVISRPTSSVNVVGQQGSRASFVRQPSTKSDRPSNGVVNLAEPIERPGKPSAASQNRKKLSCVKEVELIKQRREERRAAHKTLKEKQEQEYDTSIPNWEFEAMIREYRSTIEYCPLNNMDPTVDHQICVCVRKRPLNNKETIARETDVITIPTKDLVLVHEPKTKVDLTRYLENQQFRFDYAFDEGTNNETVYRYTAKPLVECIFERGMATCFAYGQTGSGKTHTMGGDFSSKGQQDCAKGIYALAARDVFRLLNTKYKKHDLTVFASFFEIYSGKVFDLLNHKLKLRVLEDAKQQVQIVGLKEEEIRSVEDVFRLIQHGNSERTSGVTSANVHSSRSHAIFQIILKKRGTKKVHGKFSLIDLAGNERGADTSSSDRQTRMEGAEINKSLLALKECIRALGRRGGHLPFRVSKLTQVLRDSFIGENSRTCMIAMVSPGLSCCEHSLNTLRYADRVKELGPGGPVEEKIEEEEEEPDQLTAIEEPVSHSQKNNDLAMLRSANEDEVTEELLTFHEAVHQMQIQEEELLDAHHQLTEESQVWFEMDKELLKRTEEVDYDAEGYAAELDELLDKKLEAVMRLKELVTAFRQELQEEETLSRNIHTNTRLPNK